MPLSNLKGELIRKGIKQDAIASLFGMSTENVNKKINGHVPFTISEAYMVKEKFFPEFTIDYLFKED